MQERTSLRNGESHMRVILGGWQLSSGHSTIQDIDQTLASYIKAGLDSIDCADIYTGVEDIIGRTRIMYPELKMRVHTKHVPDLSDIRKGIVDELYTRSLIERSIVRTGGTVLDLVQFHQWDYAVDSYKISISTLQNTQKEGKIGSIGVTNTSVAFLEKMEQQCDFIPMSTQNQYNIIDRRVEKYLIKHCNEKQIALYCYGSLMGGLFSEKYLGAKKPEEPLENRSLRKYLRVIDDWGGWDLFQELLGILSEIGKKYDKTISEIAMNWVLSRPGVNAIIVGARNTKYAEHIKNVLTFDLSENDFVSIDNIYIKGAPIEGDVFELERNEPRHRDIMKMNLNKD